MSTAAGSRGYDRFDELAEEFVARFRRGERPGLQEYVDRLPEMAEEIRELFPALVEVEQVRGEAGAEAAPPPAAPHLGRVGDYRILGEIGRGGMGVVYEAEQVSLGRRVAVKVLAGHLVADPKTQERFRREAKSAARLHHTNIVPVFEVGRDRDVSFYAMQLIQGQGLDQVIAELRRLRAPGREAGAPATAGLGGLEAFATVAEVRAAASSILRRDGPGRVAELLLSGRLVDDGTEAPTTGAAAATARGATERFDPEATADPAPGVASEGPPPALPASSPSGSAMLPGGTHLSEIESSGHRQPYYRGVAQIGRQAAQGLAHAHSRGVVHRDIKPSNLLLDTDGVVWITDFGLAKAGDDGLTATGDVLGTLRYMAPERFRGEGDARADVYALGLTLYELLTLRPAHESTDRLRLIERVKNEEPARPRSVERRIPRDLETIVLKAIEKEPGSRYATADAMAEDLRRFLADEPIRARQVSTSERYWRWARRNPAIAILGGVLTAVLIATAVVSTLAASRYGAIARSEKLANDRSQLDRKDAIEARRQAIEERDRSRRLSASLTLDKGIALAQEGHADRGLLWMLEALEAAPEDAVAFRRAVRWNLGAWLGQVHRPLRIIETGGPCDHLAFSPDGGTFVTGYRPIDFSIATPVELWDTASGRRLSSMPGTFAPFAFRRDGRVLFAYADASRLVALDLATRRVLWTSPPLPGDHGEMIELSPDGSTIQVSRHVDFRSGNTWLLPLDVATGRRRGEPIRGRGKMSVTPDGRTVATFHIEGGKAYIDVYELRTGRRTASWPAGARDVYDLVAGPGGKSVFGAVVEGDAFDKKSFVGRAWDMGTGRPIGPDLTRADGACYLPSADRLLTATDNALFLRDAATWRVRGSGFPAAGANPPLIAVHPDGRTLIALGGDNTVRSWQVAVDAEPVSDGATGARAPATGNKLTHETRGLNTFWSGLRADGRIAASLVRGVANRELVRLGDPDTGLALGRPVSHHAGWIIGALAFSPDGRSFATGSNPDGRVAGEVRLWDASTGRLRLPPMPHTNYIRALAFQPDGKAVAAGDYSGQVRFWDTSTGREVGRPLAQGEIVLGLAFSPDGRTLAVGLAKDHTGRPGTRLWDTATRRPIGELLPTTNHVIRIDFRPDGRALLASSSVVVNEGRATRLWDAVRGRAIGEEIPEEASGGFRPDGRAFLTLGRDGTVKLRDAATGMPLARLLIASSAATCAAFRGDGGLIAVGFEDGTVRLCDPATNQPVGPPRSLGHAVHHVAFRPDGRSVAAIDEFGESRVWPVPAPVEDASVDDLTLRIEARTGLRMEAGLFISRLGASAWGERLEQLGRVDPDAGRPDTDPAWHGPMILEAERDDNALAAIWHLDRLIAARPGEWSLRARRGRAWSLSDRFDRADDDYREAERLGSREQVLDFQVHCVVDCTRAGRWAEALWYLDRLIAARPEEGMLHEDRAAVLGKLGREADRRAELARAFELGADEGLVIPRAEELGRAGRWAEAAGLLSRCGRTGPVGRELLQAWSVACLKAGDRAGHRAACAAFLAQEGPEPTVIWNALSLASLQALAPGAIGEDRAPIAYLEERLTAAPASRRLYRHLFANALGGLLLRAGRTDEAIARLGEAIAAGEVEVPSDWAYLAMAHARKGDLAEARSWLGRLRTYLADASAPFWDLQEIELLRAEAEAASLDAAFPGEPFAGPGPG